MSEDNNWFRCHDHISDDNINKISYKPTEMKITFTKEPINSDVQDFVINRNKLTTGIDPPNRFFDLQTQGKIPQIKQTTQNKFNPYASKLENNNELRNTQSKLPAYEDRRQLSKTQINDYVFDSQTFKITDKNNDNIKEEINRDLNNVGFSGMSSDNWKISKEDPQPKSYRDDKCTFFTEDHINMNNTILNNRKNLNKQGKIAQMEGCKLNPSQNKEGISKTDQSIDIKYLKSVTTKEAPEEFHILDRTHVDLTKGANGGYVTVLSRGDWKYVNAKTLDRNQHLARNLRVEPGDLANNTSKLAPVWMKCEYNKNDKHLFREKIQPPVKTLKEERNRVILVNKDSTLRPECLTFLHDKPGMNISPYKFDPRMNRPDSRKSHSNLAVIKEKINDKQIHKSGNSTPFSIRSGGFKN